MKRNRDHLGMVPFLTSYRGEEKTYFNYEGRFQDKLY